jgi:3D (Asp-Asp-Asp) domain-containing protein
VVEKSKGVYEVRHGHIATDPRVVPTNSEVLLLVRVNGEERLLRVKASDVGQAIKGRHVDLPIYIRPGSQVAVSSIRFPKEYVRNPTVQILQPLASVSPSQKVAKASR